MVELNNSRNPLLLTACSVLLKRGVLATAPQEPPCPLPCLAIYIR